MKAIIFILTTALISFTACTQSVPPSDVTSSFQKKFDKASHVKWSRENTTEWEADFVNNGDRMSAVFNNDGVWQETETALKKSALPASVLSTIDKDFNGYRMSETSRLEKPGFNGYEVELEKGETTFEVLFDMNGHLESKKIIEEKSGDKD